MSRAAAWASKSDGPEVTGRPCRTSTSLDRTTTPQRPAGDMHCQLDAKQAQTCSYYEWSMKSTLVFMVENSYLVQPPVHHLRRSPDFLLFPCIWGGGGDKNSQFVISTDVKQHCVLEVMYFPETLVLWNEDTTICGESVPCVLYSVCMFAGGRGEQQNISWLCHIDQWPFSQSPVLCLWALFINNDAHSQINHFPLFITMHETHVSNFPVSLK